MSAALWIPPHACGRPFEATYHQSDAQPWYWDGEREAWQVGMEARWTLTCPDCQIALSNTCWLDVGEALPVEEWFSLAESINTRSAGQTSDSVKGEGVKHE